MGQSVWNPYRCGLGPSTVLSDAASLSRLDRRGDNVEAKNLTPRKWLKFWKHAVWGHFPSLTQNAVLRYACPLGARPQGALGRVGAGPSDD